MLSRLIVSVAVLSALPVLAQDAVQTEAQAQKFTVQTGTRIPLGLINSVSTKHSAAGDQVYLETVFPVVVDGKIVIPTGSHVQGTVTEVKRPGRVKGKGMLYVRFDSLILPNGVIRNFRGRVGGIDGRGSETLDRAEGKIKGDSNVGGDVKTVAETAAAGASIGAIAGAASGGAGLTGLGIGSAAGAAAGLAGVLFTRGPDAVLAKGSTIEMVLDRPLSFEEKELTFAQGGAGVRYSDAGPGPTQNNNKVTVPGRRIPF